MWGLDEIKPGDGCLVLGAFAVGRQSQIEDKQIRRRLGKAVEHIFAGSGMSDRDIVAKDVFHPIPQARVKPFIRKCGEHALNGHSDFP